MGHPALMPAEKDYNEIKEGWIMLFRRRARTPMWVWLLALLGLRQVVRGWLTADSGASGEWAEKNARFREKIREAFMVWKEPAENPAPDEES